MTGSDLDDVLDDLDGFEWIPGLAQVLEGIRTIQDAARTGRLGLEATQTLLSLLGNPDGPDLPEALALLAQEVTNPDTNPSLTALTPDTAKTVQRLGEAHARDTADYTPRTHTNEAAALISEGAPHSEGRCTAMTDEEREELMRKVKEANKASKNRPK